MAEQTSSSITIDASPEAVMAVIADFAAYPSWAHGVKSATPRGETADGRAAEVRFELDAAPIKDAYTLAYAWDGDRSVRWWLVEGTILKALDGTYDLRPVGSGTQVTYKLTVDVAIPMIGLLRRKAEKVIIDTALKGLKKRVESLG